MQELTCAFDYFPPQIRRLDIDSPKLYALQQRRQVMIDNYNAIKKVSTITFSAVLSLKIPIAPLPFC